MEEACSCDKETFVNDKKIFMGHIVPTKYFSLMTVRGTDHMPSHCVPSKALAHNDHKENCCDSTKSTVCF